MAYEGSAKDKAQDRKGAKKAGVSLKVWERSALDKKQDKAGEAKLAKKKKKK